MFERLQRWWWRWKLQRCRALDVEEASCKLSELGEDAVAELLFKRLADSDWFVRGHACEALGQLSDPRTVEPLIAMLDDSEGFVRGCACKALRQLGDPRAVEPLIARLDDSTDSARRAACEALGQLGDPRAVEPLMGRLEDSAWAVRYAAYKALGQLGDPGVVDPLIASLGKRDAVVRGGACRALGQLKDRRVAEPLIAMLDDSEDFVRGCACKALGQLGDPRAVEPLIAILDAPDSSVRYGAWGLDWRDCEDYVRSRACEALGQLGDPRAVQPLIEALKAPDCQLVKAACNALCALGQGKSAELLGRAVAGFEDTWDSFESLALLSDIPRAIVPYIAAAATCVPILCCATLWCMCILHFWGALTLRDPIQPTLLWGIACLGSIGLLITTPFMFDWLRDVRAVAIMRTYTHELIITIYRYERWALSVLPMWNSNNRPLARLALEIWRELYIQLAPVAETLLCRGHLARFERRSWSTLDDGQTPCLCCRVCGEAAQMIINVRELVCVVDRRRSVRLLEGAVPVEGVLRAWWAPSEALFDFDRVEICEADDYDVERFCIQVGNDMEPFRRPRYKKMPCIVSPDCRLSENTMRILGQTFGNVAVAPLEAPSAGSDRTEETR